MNRESKKLEKYLSGNLIILIFIPPKRKANLKGIFVLGPKRLFIFYLMQVEKDT